MMTIPSWVKRRSFLETVFIISTIVTFVLGISMLLVFRSFEFFFSIYDTSDEGFDLLALHRYQLPLCAFMMLTSVYGIRSVFGPVHHHQPLRKYAILTSSLFITQLLFSGINFFYAHEAIQKITACQASSGLNSTECLVLEKLPHFKVSYFLWQRVWRRATDEDASSSAANLLQQIQDTDICCGYGDKSGCEHRKFSTEKSVYSPVFGIIEPINKCSETDPLNYCAMTQNVSTKELQWDCTVASAWDFPYGGDGQANNGRCLNRNMIENRGCRLSWTSFVFGQVQKSSFLWLFIAMNQICVSAIAWVYLRRCRHDDDKWLQERAVMHQEKRKGSFVGNREKKHQKTPSSPTEQEALLRYQKILV